MHCSKCGNKIKADAAFCTHCGQKIGITDLAINGEEKQPTSSQHKKLLIAGIAVVAFCQNSAKIVKYSKTSYKNYSQEVSI